MKMKEIVIIYIISKDFFEMFGFNAYILLDLLDEF
jgi:hypothetical protein